ncbi:hypothetical protein [Candidatus Halocynthiibacter alkanivorans]|jgi:hypothetical protein|uniref:hypothetical protein n=1 Tax=Candidatus Halocynthiibacter alkanivorans TaxID=2267619 RepID=UPI000DF3E624|nr:hypothetical protein [Candidatus Halocynthiibacter alkanivorans]
MRDFFIGSFEKLISAIVVLLAIAVLIGAGAAAMSPDGGILAALAVLVGGTLYLVMFAGMLYVVLGIHANTRRTAEAIEKLLASG